MVTFGSKRVDNYRDRLLNLCLLLDPLERENVTKLDSGQSQDTIEPATIGTLSGLLSSYREQLHSFAVAAFGSLSPIRKRSYAPSLKGNLNRAA